VERNRGTETQQVSRLEVGERRLQRDDPEEMLSPSPRSKEFVVEWQLPSSGLG
jgi:hypothetical protein